jgi:hypothetical protein
VFKTQTDECITEALLGIGFSLNICYHGVGWLMGNTKRFGADLRKSLS